jgi:hypothetical protein
MESFMAAQTITDEHLAVLEAAVTTTIRVLQGTFVYDFSLRHPHDAYVKGINEYFRHMKESNIMQEMRRGELEKALRDAINSNSSHEACPMKIKFALLLSSLADDTHLYDTHWVDLYRGYRLPNPNPDAIKAFFCTDAPIFETRSALARYRAKLRVAESDLVQELDTCIRRYNVGLFWGEVGVVRGDEGEEEEEDNDAPLASEEPLVAAANPNHDPRRARWGRIVEKGDTWEKRDDGCWYCTECSGRMYASWVSMKRHLLLNHQLLV